MAAAILIVIGLMALAANLTGSTIGGDAIPFGIGVVFLVAYAMTRRYGFLVPGGIVTGVGAGILLASLLGISDNGVYVVLGGGLGFVLIYVVDFIVTRITARWWPLIPGTLMILVAGGMATNNAGLMRDFATWSPLVLILVGVWILFMTRRPGKQP